MSSMVEMKMSSGTKTLNKTICFDIKPVGVANTAILPQKIHVHANKAQQLSALLLHRASSCQSLLQLILLSHYSSCISGELGWFIYFTNHTYCIQRWIHSLQGFSGDNIFSTFGRVKNRQESSVENLAHRICITSLALNGLNLASVSSTKLKPNHSKNCLKKILIAVNFFFWNQSMYTQMNLSFSEKWNST